MGGGSYVPKQRNWKFFDDATPDTSMSQLANENVKPTLVNNTDIIRLRVCIAETGGKADNNVTIELQYDTNSSFSSPQSFGAAPQHFNYADGAATEGGTVDTLLLSDTGTANEYCESGINAVSIGASSTNEIDIAFVPTSSVSGTTTYYFRVLGDSTAIALDTGETSPQLTTAAAANSYTWPPDATGGGSNAEVGAGATFDRAPEVGAVLVGYGGVSTLYLDVDPEPAWGAFSSAADITASLSGPTDYVPDLVGSDEYVIADATSYGSIDYPASTVGAFVAAAVIAFSPVVLPSPACAFSVGDTTYSHEIVYDGQNVAESLFASSDLILTIVGDGNASAVLDVGDSTYTASVQGPQAYTATGDVVGAFSADHDQFVDYRETLPGSDLYVSVAADITADITGPQAYLPDTTGAVESVSVGDDTTTVHFAVQTIALDGSVDWYLYGGVSTLFLDVDSEPPVLSSSALADVEVQFGGLQGGSATFSVGSDKVFAPQLDVDVAPTFQIVEPGFDLWLSIEHPTDVLWIQAVVASDVTSNLKLDVEHTGSVETFLSVATDYEATAKITEILTGDVAVSVLSNPDYGWGYVGELVGQFSAGADIESSAGTQYEPTVGVSVLLSSDFSGEVQISSGRETGTALWNLYGGVSTIYLDVSPAETQTPSIQSAVEAEHSISFPYQQVAIVGSAEESLGVSSTYIAQVGTVVLDGNVAAVFSHDRELERSPAVQATLSVALGSSFDRSPYPTSVVSIDTGAEHYKNITQSQVLGDVTANVGVGSDSYVDQLFDEPSASVVFGAVSEVERSQSVPTAATITGDASAVFSPSHDRSALYSQDSPPTQVVSAAATYAYAYVAPGVGAGDFTFHLEGVPGRGPSQFGEWTELTMSGGWTENVGHAMSRGLERGGYTQDDSYLLEVKPNVFDTIKTISATADSDEVKPSTTFSLEGKPTTTQTVKDKPTGN